MYNLFIKHKWKAGNLCRYHIYEQIYTIAKDKNDDILSKYMKIEK